MPSLVTMTLLPVWRSGVGAGDADIGGEEFLPQPGARLRKDVAALAEHAVRRQIGVAFAKLSSQSSMSRWNAGR